MPVLLAVLLLSNCATVGKPTKAHYFMPHSGPLTICDTDVGEAVGELPSKTNIPLTDKDIFDVILILGNDELCNHIDIDGKPTHMANILVVVVSEPGKYYYGSFHIHFHINGGFKSATIMFPWLPTNDLDDKKITENWCSFLLSVYPQDYAKQCT